MFSALCLEVNGWHSAGDGGKDEYDDACVIMKAVVEMQLRWWSGDKSATARVAFVVNEVKEMKSTPAC